LTFVDLAQCTDNWQIFKVTEAQNDFYNMKIRGHFSLNWHTTVSRYLSNNIWYETMKVKSAPLSVIDWQEVKPDFNAGL